MIRLNHRVSPVQLSNLGCENLAIQTKDSTPEVTAFFDFEEILILDSHTCDTVWEIFLRAISNLNYPLQDGLDFLDMNFWLNILEYNSMQKRTCPFHLPGLDALKALSPSKQIKLSSNPRMIRGAGNCQASSKAYFRRFRFLHRKHQPAT